jgi:hypothetical protein
MLQAVELPAGVAHLAAGLAHVDRDALPLQNKMADFTKIQQEDEKNYLVSVADPECLSPILIFTHSGSRISDPGSKNSSKREG